MSEKRHAVLGIHGAEAPSPAAGVRSSPRADIRKRARLIAGVILVLLLLGAIATVALRLVHARALTAATNEHALLYVTTINAKAATSSQPVTLPGTLQGMIESTLYARSSGYVLRWYKDIGANVAKGELLADIDTPEVDQQLSQAIAAREQAASSLDLAKTSAERWEALRKKDAVTQQELNERTSAYTQAQANLAAADANVRRLQKLEGFKKVIAPFAGVVTRRSVDVGDLIDAGNGGAGRALFSLAQIDQLRVYVYVPQAYAQRIQIGDQVDITQSEMPGQTFHGKVVRTAGAIDAATRTMQMEINLPNQEHKLLAGAYVQVALPLGGASDVLIVPSNVILFRPEGARIAVVGGNGRIKLRPIVIGHDLGNSLEILSGVSLADKLVLNPPDSLADNDAVTIVQPKAAAAPQKAKL
ncbi:putative Co/Zn/Cd efflux system membrane fusion protein [Collimonas arenae]|uniref:Putative Co/Zn/Cd efflux system membrane fusion protein n=1 Tax=Collimonas arenae TaxID=279058 RepID=A0A0A1F4G5_9BURK|nr:efflux RND transporter periplasmic adaptor subunit [Collimonas arenae]AIY39431.1 putative Co/Zn/Cd efflux system membrane fusion protein [Collimonas arenae]